MVLLYEKGKPIEGILRAVYLAFFTTLPPLTKITLRYLSRIFLDIKSQNTFVSLDEKGNSGQGLQQFIAGSGSSLFHNTSQNTFLSQLVLTVRYLVIVLIETSLCEGGF